MKSNVISGPFIEYDLYFLGPEATPDFKFPVSAKISGLRRAACLKSPGDVYESLFNQILYV